MSKNAGNHENGRFYEILLTILTNMAKFLFLWRIAHNWPFLRRRRVLKKLANLAKMANLAKVAILVRFGQGCGGNVTSEYISKTRRALKMLANLAKMANLAKVAILAKFGQGC